MQHLHCLIGVILIVVGSCYAADNYAGIALNQFSLNLLSEASKNTSGNKNIVIGPYTIWTALAIVNEGAKGRTGIELRDALGIPSDGSARFGFRESQKSSIKNLKQSSDGIRLGFANDIFIKQEAAIYSKYFSDVEDIYNFEVQFLDFAKARSAAQYINNRISNITEGHIQEIVDEDLVFNSNMIVTTAMFFKGTWVKKFEKSPRNRPFYDEQGVLLKEVPVMYAGDEYTVGNILNGQAHAVEIPYKGDRISMIIVLPKNGVTLSSTLSSLTNQPFKQLLGNLRKHPEVDITMPLFNISFGGELVDILKVLNINDVFSSQADLSGISPKKLYVSSVKHRAEIEVNEEGTVAAAATATGVMPISIGSNIPVTIDRPFLFFIFDKKTDSILFMGTVNDPTAV